MMIKTTYDDYTIRVFDNSNHRPDFDTIYNNTSQEYKYASSHSIEISHTMIHQQKMVTVCAAGGKTAIHKNSFIISADTLLICCGDSVFCILLPTLELLWSMTCDTATCFGIYPYNNDFIVHGELEISRLNGKGDILWKFSGRDIFTTLSSDDVFIIKGNTITVKDWHENTYTINANTGL